MGPVSTFTGTLVHLHHRTDLNPPEPEVARYAITFIQVRALGIVPALVGFVAVACFRCHKDTKTPLYSAIVSAVCSLTFNLVFLYGELLINAWEQIPVDSD